MRTYPLSCYKWLQYSHTSLYHISTSHLQLQPSGVKNCRNSVESPLLWGFKTPPHTIPLGSVVLTQCVWRNISYLHDLEKNPISAYSTSPVDVSNYWFIISKCWKCSIFIVKCFTQILILQASHSSHGAPQVLSNFLYKLYLWSMQQNSLSSKHIITFISTNSPGHQKRNLSQVWNRHKCQHTYFCNSLI